VRRVACKVDGHRSLAISAQRPGGAGQQRTPALYQRQPYPISYME
jgi:hypothetical protein